MYVLDASAARRIRYEIAARLGRYVTQGELSDMVRARLGVGPAFRKQSIARLERGTLQRVDLTALNAIVAICREYDIDASGLIRFVETADTNERPHGKTRRAVAR